MNLHIEHCGERSNPNLAEMFWACKPEIRVYKITYWGRSDAPCTRPQPSLPNIFNKKAELH